MTQVQTTPEIAKSILESGKRKITAIKNNLSYKVQWINTNNQTCGLSGRKDKHHLMMADNEDVVFYIQVPNSAKTVF